jgi:hypothetical protein
MVTLIKKQTALPSDMKKKHEKPTSDNISHGESIGPRTGWLIPWRPSSWSLPRKIWGSHWGAMGEYCKYHWSHWR